MSGSASWTVATEEGAGLASTLRGAARELSERGLANAARWLAELLQAVPEPSEGDRGSTAQASDASSAFLQPTTPCDLYLLVKSHFDCREYKRCASLYDGKKSDSKTRWICLYARYLDHSASCAHCDGPKTSTVKPACALREILGLVGSEDDAFAYYLKGLVLSDLGRREEAIVCLVQSTTLFPYNWSAWTKLADLIEGEEELIALTPQLPPSFMSQFFQIHATLEVHRASEELRDAIERLSETFPSSVHLQAQRALVEYHMRDFELSEQLFDDIAAANPMRFEDLDTYSNILYVMGKRGKLSQVAQRYSAIDRNRPETCCLIGNFYSLRGEHAKAVALFRRAIKLDRHYLAAWTLMGHEYVEMSNTHAAIESYRRACDVNRKDYRAWYGLGQAYELLGMHTYALRYFQRATSLRPFDTRMWQALGQCYSKLAKPHEVLKCYKRAQLFAEPDDIVNLRKLGDHCLNMELLEEAAAYWSRLVEIAMAHMLPQAEYVDIYTLLAAYEMGEYHLGTTKVRVIGDLSLAEVYLNRVLADKSSETDYAKKLQQKLRALQVE